jgi:hypothetical protein
MFFSYHERMVLLYVFCMLLAVCLTGNVLTLFLITRYKWARMPVFTAIACHAFADMMIGVLWFGQLIFVLGIGNTRHFTHHRVACVIERSISAFWALGQTQNLGILAFERFIYCKYPHWYMRLISVRKILIAELAIYALAFIYVVCNALLGGRVHSVGLLHCSLYNITWYFPLTLGVWIVPPALLVLLVVITLSMLIIKQRNQVHTSPARVSQLGPISKPSQADKQGTQRRQMVTLATDGCPPQAGDANPSTSNATTDMRKDEKVEDRPAEGNETGTARERGMDVQGSHGNLSVISNVESTTSAVSISSTDSLRRTTLYGNSIRMIQTAIKLVGCITLFFYITYILCTVITLTVFTDTSRVDRQAGHYKLIQVVYLLGLKFSTIVNPVFHLCFNRPLKKALFKMIGIKLTSH